MEIDTKDPMVRRFAEAIIAWTPGDWEALDARIAAHAKLRLERRGPPTLDEQRFHNFIARTVKLLDPSPEAVMGMLRRLTYRSLGPRWRRQGTGLIRRLYETLEHPWVNPAARMQVAMTLAVLSNRRIHPIDLVQQMYAPFEAAIPWTLIAPSLLPGGTGEDNPG